MVPQCQRVKEQQYGDLGRRIRLLDNPLPLQRVECLKVAKGLRASPSRKRKETGAYCKWLGPKSPRRALDLPKRRQRQAARPQDAGTEGALTPRRRRAGRAGTGTTPKVGTEKNRTTTHPYNPKVTPTALAVGQACCQPPAAAGGRGSELDTRKQNFRQILQAGLALHKCATLNPIFLKCRSLRAH